MTEPTASAVASCPTCGNQGDTSCPTCAKGKEAQRQSSPYVYALGRVDFRYPRVSDEKEVAQVAKKIPTEGLTDIQVLKKVLAQREHRYLVRRVCWTFRIEDQETFILQPADPLDWELLVAALRPSPQPTDLDAVVGVLGHNAPPERCNALTKPMVTFDQLYSFDRKSLIQDLMKHRPEKTPADKFEPAAEALLNQILRITNNTGVRDEDRTLNYLAVRHPGIYVKTAEALMRNSTLRFEQQPANFRCHFALPGPWD
jgi:hypothetical protein